MSSSNGKTSVLFVHGLWLHGDSWNNWIELFRARGYDAIAASWPGDGASAEATRSRPNALAKHGVKDIADHIAIQIARLGKKPVVIGHSFGGLLAQNLLGRNLASAAIAIDPAPIKGVLQLPLSALRAAFPVLSNPLNYGKSVSLTEPQFRFAFANAVPEREARELYAKHAIPAPGRPLFQAASAAFNPAAETRVNVSNGKRGPLLFISGSTDHTVPPVVVKSAFRMYRRSSATTELHEFENRGHSLTIDSGWREVADYCLAWMQGKGLQSAPVA
jgi:pimeloyl-ACP methyl ester carboxylesterase